MQIRSKGEGNDSDSESEMSEHLDLASSHSSDDDDEIDVQMDWENTLPKNKKIGKYCHRLLNLSFNALFSKDYVFTARNTTLFYYKDQGPLKIRLPEKSLIKYHPYNHILYQHFL